MRLLIGLLSGALVIHLFNLPPLVAGAVLVSTAAFMVLCPLLIWLANASRF